jgi:hypothetical protein
MGFIRRFSATLAMIGLVAASAAVAQADDLVFAGVLVSDGQTHVIIIDGKNHHSSGWIRLGQTFGDFRIESYDATGETLTLLRNGAPLRLHLVSDAKVLTGGTTVQLGDHGFTIIADHIISTNGQLTFRGSVTAIGQTERISSSTMTYDPAQNTLVCEGDVRAQNQNRLLMGESLILSLEAKSGKLIYTARAGRVTIPPKEPPSSSQ